MKKILMMINPPKRRKVPARNFPKMRHPIITIMILVKEIQKSRLKIQLKDQANPHLLPKRAKKIRKQGNQVAIPNQPRKEKIRKRKTKIKRKKTKTKRTKTSQKIRNRNPQRSQDLRR